MKNFQFYRLNFGEIRVCLKCIIIVTNFQKFTKSRGLSTPGLFLTFDVGDPKLRDLAKLWFFKLIITKLYFKNTKSSLNHRKNVSKLLLSFTEYSKLQAEHLTKRILYF